MIIDKLKAQKDHLSNLLEAIERCVYFLNASLLNVPVSIEAAYLQQNQKDTALFESLSAINERFSKLQDILSSAMRHATVLSGESSDNFLNVLAFYEKSGVIESTENWQLYRTKRNIAAHEYDVNYNKIAEHFNAIKELYVLLEMDSNRFIKYCEASLNIKPASNAFSARHETLND